MSKKILIVDDSALMRRVMCDIINSDGTFQVTDTCRDGLEAYEKLKTAEYGYRMPVSLLYRSEEHTSELQSH